MTVTPEQNAWLVQRIAELQREVDDLRAAVGCIRALCDLADQADGDITVSSEDLRRALGGAA